MNITTYPDSSAVISGKPEELVLYNKLSSEWDLFYGELKTRSISLADALTKRKGKNANDILSIILKGGNKHD